MTAEIILLGAGAVGSHFADLLPPDIATTIVDAQLVERDNLATSRFAAADCSRPKAVVAAERRAARGAVARALHGDLRFTVRPGLLRALDAVVMALDNPTAIRDLAEAIWGAGVAGPPLLGLTCGNDATGGGYQVRCFPTGRERLCPCCLFGEAERRADRAAPGASCSAFSAPRASAEAAAGAADLGVRTLLEWIAGGRSAAGRRVQSDGGREYYIQLPERPAPGCPVPHHPDDDQVIVLEEGIDHLTVGSVAERALSEVGDDATLLLGRRGVPMLGMQCARCRLVTPAPLRLVPAAASECGCGEPTRPLATRSQVGVRELLARDVAPLALREFGCAPGEELSFAGSRGSVRLRARFAWSEIQ